MRPSLAALRALGLRLVVVSNANGALHRAFDRLGLTGEFDVIFDSHVEGVEKPDPRFFQIALDRSARAPRRRCTSAISITWTSPARAAAGITPALLDAANLLSRVRLPARAVADRARRSARA